MKGCENFQKKTVKQVNKPLHIILFIVNIIWAGLGTMISACIAKDGFDVTTLIVGLLQMLTAWLLIGWIWSIWWGYLIYKKS